MLDNHLTPQMDRVVAVDFGGVRNDYFIILS